MTRVRLLAGRIHGLVDAVFVVLLVRLRPRLCVRRLPAAAPGRRVFVVGSARSGTSWVQHLLQAHPEVIGTEESYLAPRSVNAMTRRPRVLAVARLLYGYDRGRLLGRRVGLQFYVTRAQLRRFAAGALAAGAADRDRAARLMHAVLDQYWHEHAAPRVTVLVEKTPTHLQQAEVLLDTFPESKVIEVLRDGRDVVTSMQQIAPEDSWLPPTVREQAEQWAAAVTKGAALAADPRYHGRVESVRYEDLQRDPDGQLARLFRFIGIAPDTETVHTITTSLEFDDARRGGRGHHLRRGMVGDWANHLDAGQLATFDEVAGAAFRARGYVPE